MIEITLADGFGNQIQNHAHESRAHLLIKNEYTHGAQIRFAGNSPFLWVQVDQAIAPALLYLPKGIFTYEIPQGDERLAYPPQAFSGESHLVRAWLPAKEEMTAKRRNLALNPADQRKDANAYPHVTANVETRGEAVFAARNVIDGALENTFHGEWPYQSWGIGARDDAWCKLEFGRPVKVWDMALVLRADFPHDAYWTQGKVVLSDGTEISFMLTRTGDPQHVPLGGRTVTWLRLEGLVKSDDPSAFPALTEWQVCGEETKAAEACGISL